MPFGTWPRDKKYKKVGRIVVEMAKTGFEAYGLAAVWHRFGTVLEEFG